MRLGMLDKTLLFISLIMMLFRGRSLVSKIGSFSITRTMTDYYRTKLHSTAMDDIVETLKEELIPLRGKPELVDRLESLVVKYPGIEVK